METELLSFSGLVLMFVLGLRHGLDPDHIACIDGLTWRALNHEHQHAHWIGTLFAIGHGLLVTGIAVGVSQFTRSMSVPDVVVTVFGWIPTALLLLVGTLNLRLLMRKDPSYVPTGWKLRLIPQRLRNHSSPWAVVVIGVLFATVFDTATQASAWGYVASNKGGGLMAAFLAGIVFTLGMVITDTLDGRLICRISRGTDGQAAGRRFRRTLGWLIVAISYGVAAYNVGKAVIPAIELDEVAFSVTGFALMAVMFVIWAWVWNGRRPLRYAARHPNAD
ncbi:MAG: nickel permease [Bacteriovorax sp.]|nr:nickel permease [Rhizobacter sp.]